MIDPPRLLDDKAFALERRLLSAGRAERPATGSRLRAVRTVSAVAGATLWTKTAWAVSEVASIAAIHSGKLLVIVALAGGTTWAVVAQERAVAPQQAGQEASPRPTVKAARQSVPKPEVPNVSTSALPSLPRQADAPRGSRRAPPATLGRAHTTADQVRKLDKARAALRKNPQQTLALLEQYSREYPKGSMRQEASLLRVEALMRVGQKDRARELGKQFRTAHPNSPYTRRLDSLLGTQ